jgi:thiol:disulfide interchange protein DsbD
MKKTCFLTLLLAPLLFFGQAMNPVKWEAKYTESSNGEGEIILTASIEKGWHMYSIHLNPEAGPVPTSVTYSPGSNYEITGKTTEEGVKEEYDKMFDMKIGSFDGKAVIKQKIKRKNLKEFQTPLKIEYMVCNDKQCLPPKTIDVILTVPAKK